MCAPVQVLWECGGTLAAPAIAAGVIHKALAFIAPKLVRCVPPVSVLLPSPISLPNNVHCSLTSTCMCPDEPLGRLAHSKYCWEQHGWRGLSWHSREMTI
jgi:riboflavin biosynthesis pyrimidine reductase